MLTQLKSRKMLSKRIYLVAEEEDLFPESQLGFPEHRGVDESLLIFASIQEDYF